MFVGTGVLDEGIGGVESFTVEDREPRVWFLETVTTEERECGVSVNRTNRILRG